VVRADISKLAILTYRIGPFLYLPHHDETTQLADMYLDISYLLKSWTLVFTVRVF